MENYLFEVSTQKYFKDQYFKNAGYASRRPNETLILWGILISYCFWATYHKFGGLIPHKFIFL